MKWVALLAQHCNLYWPLFYCLHFAMKEQEVMRLKCYLNCNTTGFLPWNINFHVGVDGISVAMILLTSFVVMAGVLVSWNIDEDDQRILFLTDTA